MTPHLVGEAAATKGTAVGDLPIPNGWFAICLSADLGAGDSRPVTLGDHELVVARTASGDLLLFDAYCPHLGAHLGHAGRVVGEHLQCRFHGFEFDAAGTFLGKAGDPVRLNLRRWSVMETCGVVFAFYDRDHRPPWWRPQPSELAERSSFRWRSFEFAGHPIDTTENAVDFAHFGPAHAYTDLSSTKPLHVDGERLRAGYSMRRATGVGPLAGGLLIDFEITAWGLGFSEVAATVPAFDARFPLLFLATPVRRGTVVLRLGTGLPERLPGDGRLVRALVKLVSPAARAYILAMYARDVRQDVSVWRTKVHIPRPPVSRNDGPIVDYRRWARQFMVAS